MKLFALIFALALFVSISNPGLADEYIPEVSVESVLQHPSVAERIAKVEEIRDWEYERNRIL